MSGDVPATSSRGTAATWQGPIIEQSATTGVVVASLADGLRRLDRRALLAWVALVCAAVAWDRIHFINTAGEWPPRGIQLPGEFWLSILAVEVIVYGLLIVAVSIADAAVERGTRPTVAYVMAVIAAIGLGAWLQRVVRHALGWRLMADMPGVPPEYAAAQPFLIFLEVGMRAALIVTVYVSLRETRLALLRTRDAETARAAAHRRTYESRLQALQARVEPQFLSNALAQVRRIGVTDPVRATTMLDDLIAYLRATLPHLRESSSTLGKEVELAQAWLRIVRSRSDSSAAFHFDLDEHARGAAIPPMVLLPIIACTLDEDPSAPRTLRVSTSADEGRVRVAIANATAARAPSELGVTRTIRERLQALYGDAATLHVTWSESGGTCATLELPHESTDRDHR